MTDRMELGFYFHPSKDEFSLGCIKLDVNVYAKPTGDHFDPDQLSIPVIGIDGNGEELKITHPWRGLKNYKVSPGRIIISDRYEKKVEAYSFGGNLEISNYENHVNCSITSPAPIIPMINETNSNILFVSEFEAILAKLRANYDRDSDFERDLSSIDPFVLYTAGLANVKDWLKEIPARYQDENYTDTYQIIVNTIQLLKENGEWPAIVPLLEKLLGT